jgi:uncharacterized protein
MEKSEVDQLAHSGFFQNKPISGRVIETNISWVILVEKFAFKIKKPIKLSFLDYSTLRKRKENCERELWLNRRYTKIYLSVIPIRYHENQWHLGEGPGKVMDYAVCMRKLQNSRKMDVLLKANKVHTEAIQRLASVLANFHKEAEIIKTPFCIENAKAIFNDLASIKKIALEEIGKGAVNKIDQCITWSNQFLKLHSKRLEERIKGGWVRDLHGDLHSGNIFLYREPVIFDCIEFQDSFRQIDILYEIAFICMDLEFHKRRDLASEFLIFYIRELNPFFSKEDEEIFNYFKALRANVRAKVYFLNAASDTDLVSKNQHLSVATLYLDLLFNYKRM